MAKYEVTFTFETATDISQEDFDHLRQHAAGELENAVDYLVTPIITDCELSDFKKVV